MPVHIDMRRRSLADTKMVIYKNKNILRRKNQQTEL